MGFAMNSSANGHIVAEWIFCSMAIKNLKRAATPITQSKPFKRGKKKADKS